MGNMSYCRFENAYQDLEDCMTALQEQGVKGVLSEASDNEKPYIKDLIKMCREIADDFEDDLDEEESNN